MKTKISIIFALLLLGNTRNAAALGPDSSQNMVQKNVDDFHGWFSKNLSEFPKDGQSLNQQISYARQNSQRSGKWTANDYKEAAQSNYVKQQVLNDLTTLAQQLVQTAGTQYANQSAQTLQNQAKMLGASGDPQFIQAASALNQEAQAIQQGDVNQAQAAADQVANIPKPYVPPGYTPTQGEDLLAGVFTTMIGGIFTSFTGILGQVFVSQLLASLGVLGQANYVPSNIAGQAAGGLASGQKPANVGSNAVVSGGTAAGSAVNSTVYQSLNTVPAKSLNSSNSDTAPTH